MEANFGFRICDSKPSDTGSRGHLIPWMLMRSTLSRQAKEKGHRVRVMDVLSVVEHIFNETAMQARTPASNTQKHRQPIVWQKQTEQVMVQD